MWRALFSLKLALTFILPVAAAQAIEVTRIIEGRPMVMELFTSQGCNSCPPADALLSRLSERRDVLALSQHVDYWNYIGWEDPFSSPHTSNRQRRYAARMGLRRIYTPQMIIGGTVQEIGSDPHSLRRALSIAPRPITDVSVTVKEGEAHFRINEADAASDEPLTVWVAELNQKRTTAIKRGENGGKRLTYHHIVRAFYPIATWHGDESDHVIALKPLWENDRDGIALIVQEGEHYTGAIRAAAALFMRAP